MNGAAADTVEADRAIGAGDLGAAIAALERAAAAAPGYDVWIRLGALRRATGALAPAMQAVEAALAFRPLDFAALLSRAMLLEALDPAASGEAFQQALAQRPRGDLPPALRATVAHAEARAAAFVECREARMQAALAAIVGKASDTERARIDRFRSNALRQTWVHHSDPTHFHYPGLVEREFHDRADFPWIAALEEATDMIAAEFAALMNSGSAAQGPYLRYAEHEPIGPCRSLNQSRDWTAIHLWEDGRRIAANADLCPETMAILNSVGQPLVPGMSPSAMFSLLAPGTRIPPHTGVTNTRLICHLPLTVPPGCWFRVGAESRDWSRGEAFVFDDSIEHEAMNPSDALRVLLIFDVWHPGLSAAGRASAAAVMTSVQDFVASN